MPGRKPTRFLQPRMRKRLLEYGGQFTVYLFGVNCFSPDNRFALSRMAACFSSNFNASNFELAVRERFHLNFYAGLFSKYGVGSEYRKRQTGSVRNF